MQVVAKAGFTPGCTHNLSLPEEPYHPSLEYKSSQAMLQ